MTSMTIKIQRSYFTEKHSLKRPQKCITCVITNKGKVQNAANHTQKANDLFFSNACPHILFKARLF